MRTSSPWNILAANSSRSSSAAHKLSLIAVSTLFRSPRQLCLRQMLTSRFWRVDAVVFAERTICREGVTQGLQATDSERIPLLVRTQESPQGFRSRRGAGPCVPSIRRGFLLQRILCSGLPNRMPGILTLPCSLKPLKTNQRVNGLSFVMFIRR
jgi:hypothetical protein